MYLQPTYLQLYYTYLFLNNWKLDPKHNRIKVMLGDEQRITDKHVLAKVLKICHTWGIELDPKLDNVLVDVVVVVMTRNQALKE
jgi:hypothetical protein